MRRSLLIIFVLSLIAGNILPAQSPPGDAILILEMAPDSFHDGQEAETTVTIAYTLVSSEEGIVDLCSNELAAQAFSPFAHVRIKKGSGKATISGKMIPRYWTRNAPAKISVTMRSARDVEERRLFATDEAVISVLRPARPVENAQTNPPPHEIFEDTIVIKSIAPAKLVEGQATEVVVTVGYELLSREKGEINLGYSAGRGNGYAVIGSALIQIGAGETTVRGKIIPTKTGSLPFSKIFVNLSEYPHRAHWSPLANDVRVVDVE